MSLRFLAASALTAGALTALAAPAAAGPWDDVGSAVAKHAAVAYSPTYKTWGTSVHANANTASAGALSQCGRGCVLMAVQQNGCVALAVFENNYAAGQGATRHVAIQSAAKKVARSRVVATQCV